MQNSFECVRITEEKNASILKTKILTTEKCLKICNFTGLKNSLYCFFFLFFAGLRFARVFVCAVGV